MEVVVTILIKKKLKVKELKLPPPPEAELIAVKINTLRNIIVATLYMPPPKKHLRYRIYIPGRKYNIVFKNSFTASGS